MAGYSAYASVQMQSADEVINRHATLVKRIAHHLLARLPASVQLDDLIQAGMIGLLEAAKNYDPNKGASFETYAGIRIRGMMIDEVRRHDWVPRSVHRNARMIAEAVRKLENELGRDVRDLEIAKELDVPLETYHQMLRDCSSSRLIDLNDIDGADDIISRGMSEQIPGPLDDLQSDSMRERIAAAIDSLPEREKLVLSLYYTEELNLKEIGQILEVSESRVSQIHSQAMLRVRARIQSEE